MKIFWKLDPIVRLPRVTQATDSHCGPAVVQSLFAFLNKEISQDQVVDAARVRSTLKRHGTRPDQLARAVGKLDPTLQFWFKQHATVKTLDLLINTYHWPVAINWQGLFYDTEEEQMRHNPNGEHGHYSVAIGIDIAKDKITIADPYAEYSIKPRTFSLKWFVKRWWDIDHINDKKTGKKDSIYTKHFIFLITPKEKTFPKELKMQLPDKLDMLKKNV